MKNWSEVYDATDSLSDARGDVRDLTSRDRARADKIAEMRRLLDDGIKNGDGARLKEALFSAAVARAGAIQPSARSLAVERQNERETK